MVLEAIAALAAAIWLYLVFARGGFWLCSERHEGGRGRTLPASLASWPSVTVVIPARNEADGIAETIGSLLRQDYAGAFKIILVDDNSSDGTAEVARRCAGEVNAAERLEIIAGQAAAARLDRQAVGGEAGRRRGAVGGHPPDYILLSDADIVYSPDVLARPGGARSGQQAGADLVDGEAALRELRRAQPHSGLHLLFPDALSVPRG